MSGGCTGEGVHKGYFQTGLIIILHTGRTDGSGIKWLGPSFIKLFKLRGVVLYNINYENIYYTEQS